MKNVCRFFLSVLLFNFLFTPLSAQIVITEIMQNPGDVSDPNGEWFEIFNNSASPVDLNGWTIKDNGTDLHVIDNGGPLVIAANGYMVLGRNADQGTNGGVPVDYQWSSFTLGNADDEIIILDGSLNEIDRVEWDGGPNFPDPSGASMVFDTDPMLDNNDGSNWTTSTIREPNYNLGGTETDFGSPGTGSFSDTPLPVELKSFTALSQNSKVILNWSTASEINNHGFIILRASEKEASYSEISSYKNNANLIGAGSSSIEHKYSYTDNYVYNGKTYWYKLVDVDINGVMKEHGPVSATPHAKGGIPKGDVLQNFTLFQNFPNPFNPSTTITYDVSELKEKTININISVYDILGKKIRTLFMGLVTAGRHSVKWNAKDQHGHIVPAGLYIYQISSERFIKAKKMMYIK